MVDTNTSVVSPQEMSPATGQLSMSLRDHGITFFLPPNSRLEFGRFELDGGALISGEMRGDLVCRKGSVLITRTGRFVGNIEADRIYVEGMVGDPKSPDFELAGRLYIAVASTASVIAHLRSRSYAIHSSNMFGRIDPW